MNSTDDINTELENARAIFEIDGSKLESVPMTTEIYSEQPWNHSTAGGGAAVCITRFSRPPVFKCANADHGL